MFCTELGTELLKLSTSYCKMEGYIESKQCEPNVVSATKTPLLYITVINKSIECLYKSFLLSLIVTFFFIALTITETGAKFKKQKFLPLFYGAPVCSP